MGVIEGVGVSVGTAVVLVGAGVELAGGEVASSTAAGAPGWQPASREIRMARLTSRLTVF